MASTRADFIWEEPRLGAGSFGEVHRVRRRADGVTYVIKTISAALSRADQEASLNEVRLLASVDHPRVVRYYDSFVDGGRLHIVMEHCERGDLAMLLEARAGAPLGAQARGDRDGLLWGLVRGGRRVRLRHHVARFRRTVPRV